MSEYSKSSAVSGNPNLLAKKVAEYKRLYFFLKMIAYILLAFVIIYILVLLFAGTKVYAPLSSNLVAGSKMATDASGKLIAFPVYNLQDSTGSIMISNDSGKYFKQSGLWKLNFYYDPDPVKSISIAPDNESIIAISSSSIFIKPAGADSFTYINTSSLSANPYSGNGLISLCFAPRTDSVYVYDYAGNLFCLNYKHCDSIITARLNGISWFRSMTVNNNGEIVAIAYDTSGRTGMYKGNILTDIKKYATKALTTEVVFNNTTDTVKGNINDNIPDTANSNMADSSKYTPPAGTNNNTIKKSRTTKSKSKTTPVQQQIVKPYNQTVDTSNNKY